MTARVHEDMTAAMPALHLVIGNKNYSSWSMRPWLALKLSGLAFTEEVKNLDSQDTAAWLAREAPAARVPVLDVDGLRVWDSLAIIERVAELSSVPIWPSDPAARSIARAAAAEMHSGFAAMRQSLPMNIRARFPSFSVPPAVEPEIRRIQALWASCRERYGASGDFLFGSFSAADCVYAPVVMRFVTYSVPLAPASKAYVDAVRANPLVTEWIEAATSEPWSLERFEGRATG